MAELKKTADYILVDSAPLLLVSDPPYPRSPRGCRHGARPGFAPSTRGEMEEVRSLLEKGGNRAYRRGGRGVKHRRGYYHRRGYGYGHGYGYGYR